MSRIGQRAEGSRGPTRREFLWLASLAAAGTAGGCATNPVTGQSQLMLLSEQDEIGLDRQHSPHQFSTDYGATQDRALSEYLQRTGLSMSARTHRPRMPYSFRCVNAVYINAYAFPGGSIAVTRGILLKLNSEAELAALLGHELGHVNSRHSASQASQGMMTQMALAGAAVVVGAAAGGGAGDVAQALGMLGAGALLASYSRDHEREADGLGMEYTVRSGYSPEGMVGLMAMLNSLHKGKPGSAELLFATHPMSDERYTSMAGAAQTRYAAARGFPLHRERYLDAIAGLRARRGAIEALQQGEEALGRKKYPDAETAIRTALQQAPDDYAGLLLMSKCLLSQNRVPEAQAYTDQARRVYPTEAQARHLGGITRLKRKDFDGAQAEFAESERLLPGNPSTVFLRGLSQEGAGRRRESAQEYQRYLQQVQEGKQAQYATQRLQEWGYLKK
jgi:beta-barrel assembly-enhancing protease